MEPFICGGCDGTFYMRPEAVAVPVYAVNGTRWLQTGLVFQPSKAADPPKHSQLCLGCHEHLIVQSVLKTLLGRKDWTTSES